MENRRKDIPADDFRERTLARFAEYIKGRNMRQTPERKAILERVIAMRPHFAVEELYEVMDKDYHVSLATVYNNVELLCQSGILRRHFLSDQQAVYELADDSHLHLVCTECGSVRVSREKELNRQVMSMRFNGFVPVHYSTTIYGVCASCLRKRRRESDATQTQENI